MTEAGAGRYMRLRGTIRSVLQTINDNNAAMAAQAASDAYQRLRSEARDVIPGELVDEFDRLFPELSGAQRRSGSHDLFSAAARTAEAQTLLSSMAGWIDGLIEEEQQRAAAEERRLGQR